MEINLLVVYIVDDDEVVWILLVWLLSLVNIWIECFDGFEVFLKVYDVNSLFCLILDVCMFEISGFQLQDCLKEIGVDIFVIFVLGYGDIFMLVCVLYNGVVDFLEKFYNLQQMLECIQMMFKNVVGNMQVCECCQQLKVCLKIFIVCECEILEKVIMGQFSKFIVCDFNISVKMVDVYCVSVKDKLGCQSMVMLVCDVLMDFGLEFFKVV